MISKCGAENAVERPCGIDLSYSVSGRKFSILAMRKGMIFGTFVAAVFPSFFHLAPSSELILL